jgi:hypothetical protein
MPEFYRRPGGDVKYREKRTRSAYSERTHHTDQKTIDFRSPLIAKYSKTFPAPLGRREWDLLEDMGGWRLRRRKRQLQMIRSTASQSVMKAITSPSGEPA